MNHVIEIGAFHHIAATSDGGCIASAWGPAADGTGDWFVSPFAGAVYRVAGKTAALAELDRLAGITPAVTA